MVLIGCDFHPGWQQVSWLNRETGETGDQKLVHEAGATEKFYNQFPVGSRIGMEATGNCQWFLELMTKRLEILLAMAPRVRRPAVLINVDNAFSETVVQAMATAASALAIAVREFPVRRSAPSSVEGRDARARRSRSMSCRRWPKSRSASRPPRTSSD